MIAVNSKGTAVKIPVQRQTSPVKYKINAKGKFWAKVIGAVMLFLLAVGIGHSQGVKDGQKSVPATVQAQLTWCETHSATPCHAEFMLHTPLTPGAAARKTDTGPAGWDVVADH